METAEQIIRYDYPPNIEQIDAAFNVKTNAGVVYTYAPHVYVPAARGLPPEIMAHEAVHLEQQKQAGGPQAWWDRYIADPVWRVEQELEAHKIEYLYYCHRKADRNARARYMHMLAQRLSLPMYGSAITYVEAKKRLMQGLPRSLGRK